MMDRYPPGPRDRIFGLSYLRQFRTSPVAFVSDVARKYGDYAYARVGWFRVYFINRPELVREILATKAKSFHKLRRQAKSLRAIEGDGVVVSEGARWREHRPMVQPAFHSAHFDRYARLIVEHAARRAATWPVETTFDMSEAMNHLALEIIARLVFDVDWSGQAARLRQAVEVFREYMQREMGSLIRLPDWLPLPGKLRQRRAVRAMDEMIWDLIRRGRASGSPGVDMLSRMMAAARGSDAARPITDREFRDEAATLFVAGHDTTSTALGWLWYVLARDAEAQRRVREEVDTVLGGRTATYADLPRLRHLEMAVKESMRLYPAAAFLFARQAIEDVEIGGHVIRKGGWIFISPYVMHRDARAFPDPETFDPDRFAPGRVESIPDYAYIPFGGGPRICIGSALAIMEVVLVAATVLQRFHLSLAPEQGEAEPEVEVVLRPRGGLRMRLTPRHQG